MKVFAVGLGLVLVLFGCATVKGARTIGPAPSIPTQAADRYSIPEPFWPIRHGLSGPQPPAGISEATNWLVPEPPLLEPLALAPQKPALLPELPLPEVRSLPLKAAPASRSWASIAEMKSPSPGAVELLPTPPTPPVAKTPVPKPAKAAAKAPATVPAAALPPEAPPTAAATASLLPGQQPVSSDFNWQDINAVAGDAVTLHFDKTNWIYLDSPSQQKALGFQSIARDKNATTFQFKPKIPGQYTLEFQRQDLVNQTTDSRKVKLLVVATGTRTSTTGTALAPQTSSTLPNDALEASRLLASTGRTAEAVQRLLQSYKADDARMNLELARLLNQTGQDDQALSYLDKNLTMPGPDFEGTLELGTKLAALRDPEKKLPSYVKLWTSGTTAPPEDLYLQVFEALRKQKFSQLVQDWSGHYSLWYPAPQMKDGYLFQSGQFLEEPGPGRNIQNAWKAYNEVVQNYPLSAYWKLAGERAAYLNRHFLQAR